jgi:hypothetical protein
MNSAPEANCVFEFQKRSRKDMWTTIFGWLQLLPCRAQSYGGRDFAQGVGISLRLNKAETFRRLIRAKEKVRVIGWLIRDQEHAADLGKYRRTVWRFTRSIRFKSTGEISGLKCNQAAQRERAASSGAIGYAKFQAAHMMP